MEINFGLCDTRIGSRAIILPPKELKALNFTTSWGKISVGNFPFSICFL